MVWAAIGFTGRTELVFIDGHLNAASYKDILQRYLIPFAERIAGPEWIFQQDNCSVHTANLVKQWMAAENMEVLPWPSRSPDLNIIENMWGALVRRVYGNCKQYSSIPELKSALISIWEVIEQEYIQTLVHSMKNQIFELITKGGNKINY